MRIEYALVKLIFLNFFLLFMGSVVYGQTWADRIKKYKVNDGGRGYEYMVYTPASYNGDSGPFPILFYLHGSSEISHPFDDDFSSFRYGPPKLIHNLKSNSFAISGTKWPIEADKFVIIVPHLRRDPDIPQEKDQLWSPDSLKDVLEDFYNKGLYNINPQRVYMSGISLGAKGVWDYAKKYHETLTAIVPISGNSNIDEDICNLKNLPIWALHGDADRQVPPDGQTTQGRPGTYILIDAINKCSPSPKYKPRLTKMKDLAHEDNAFNPVYDLTNGYNIYEWFLKFEKGAENNKSPIASIFVPGKKFLLNQNGLVIPLVGHGFDVESDKLAFDWTPTGDGPDVEFIDVEHSEPADSIAFVKITAPGSYSFRLVVRETETVGRRTGEKTFSFEVRESYSATLPSINGLSINGQVIENNKRININADDSKIAISANETTNMIKVGLNDNLNHTRVRCCSEVTFLEDFDGSPTVLTLAVTPYPSFPAMTNEGVTTLSTIFVNQDPPIVLPVEFLNVSAARTANHVAVAWATASEDGNDFFTIERSPSSSDAFVAIGTVEGAGDSKSLKKYSFLDYSPLAGRAYYRIRQTDFDGKSDYSKIVSVEGHNQFEASLFPNPAEAGATYLKILTADYHTDVEVQVMDAVGNVHYNEKLSPELLGAKDGFLLSSAKSLSAGLYFVLVKQGEEKLQKKMIVK